ncbi:contractile injection system sheath initiator [Methanobrevibacter filiformis]|uniref:DUF2634 domain-containing protein n=1 Tax=Methanobrevibacter filiformis TaxID=55758 RepID=A0A166FAR6_9EURY|nr:DUF2634 domain-containing protein [Methanobrevibacter filiformis]KZX17478.1 hypothetical protein MBFIL_01360 [Methanobrevibacter filiformis]
MVDFGCDFHRDFELIDDKGNFRKVSGVDNAKQAIINRLLTIPGDLDNLGYDDYGNKSYYYLGLTDYDYAESLIKKATEEALLKEPVVAEIIDINVEYDNTNCIVDIDVRLVSDDDEDTNENITIDLNNVEEVL